MNHKVPPWELDKQWLLHDSVQDSVPPGDLAHFVCAVAREVMDLDEIFEIYADDVSRSPSYPAMMTALLLYAFHQGIYSSRRIARACETRVDFMALTALQSTSFDDIRRFRRRASEMLPPIVAKFLKLCQKLDLPIPGEGKDDDSDAEATVMGFGAADEAVAQKASDWLKRAATLDDHEDDLHGKNDRGDGLPSWLESKAKRLRKLREARDSIEQEERAKIEAQRLLAEDPEDELEPEPESEREREPPPRESAPSRAKRPSRVDRSARAVRLSSSRLSEEHQAAVRGKPAKQDELGRIKSQNERIVLMETMVATAMADGHVAAIEQRRIDQLIRLLRLSPRERQQVYALIRSNKMPEIPGIDEIPEYDTRLQVFEQAAIMALADGDVHPKEKKYLRELAASFELDRADARNALVRANEATDGRR
jgi:transposase/uncharacterized tellurite resistance protein B-like protein